MNATEDLVTITAQMYQARRAVKEVYGDRYREVIMEYCGRIEAEMARAKCCTVQAMINLIKRNQDRFSRTVTKAMLTAACVEIIEPSDSK